MKQRTQSFARSVRARFWLFALLIATTSGGCGRTATAEREAPGNASRSDVSGSKGTEDGRFPKETSPAPALRYLSFNLGGSEQQAELPMVIAIHGLGDTPQNFSHWLVNLGLKLRLIVPQAPSSYGHGYSWFPYRADRTEHELAQGIASSRDRLEQLLDELERRFPTRGKPAVLGFSQGGMLSFALAAHAPERFSLVIPLGGLLPSELDPAPMATPGSRPEVLAFHGVEDRIVPFAEAKRTTERLSTLGYVVHLQGYDGVGHQIPPPMRDAVFAKLREWAH